MNWEIFVSLYNSLHTDAEVILSGGSVPRNNDKLERLVVDHVRRKIEWELGRITQQTADIFKMCESPIEELFAFGLIQSGQFLRFVSEQRNMDEGSLDAAFDRKPADDYPVWFFDGLPVDTAITSPTDYERFFLFRIFPQYRTGKRRADFLIQCFAPHDPRGKRSEIIVECDGYAFHDSSIEQKVRDKKRERELMAEGYQVLRFSGSEIYRDPLLCAQEVIDYLKGQQGE